MDQKRLEQELEIAKHILEVIEFSQRLCQRPQGGYPTDSYMQNFLREVSDRASIQVSLLQEILKLSEEFESAARRNHEKRN